MDCRKVNEIIFLLLDEELDADTCTLVRDHITQCPACSSELKACERISQGLQQMAKASITPPSGFSDAVMARINANTDIKVDIIPAKRRFSSWYTIASGVAAVALLSFGAYLLPSGTTQIADNEPAVVDVLAPDNAHDDPNPVSNNEPGYIEPVDIDTNVNKPNINQNGVNTDPKLHEIEPVTEVTAPNPVEPTTDFDAYRALLTDARHQLLSTMLHITAADIDEAENKAAGLAVNAQAAFQPLGRQTDGDIIKSSYKITAAYDKADLLIAQLSALGTVGSIQTESRDNDYDDKLQLLLNIQNQINNTDDVDKIKALEEQFNQLAQQLQNWNKDCEKQTIVLWLQNK